MNNDIRTIIVRSVTGVYHKGSTGSTSTWCNSRAGGFGTRPAKQSDVEKAGEQVFFKKCFGRKPDEERMEYFFPKA